jgi:hypothetical protein
MEAGSTLSRLQLMVLIGVYFVVVAVGIAHHEMWRDELHAWMIARDSGSVRELLHKLRYEGHPAAWHLLLFFLSRFTRSPVAMQILHLALATATVFVVVRWSPFTALQKAVLPFGYFFLYEYAVISRGYVLGTLALFAICAVFPSRSQSYLPIGVLLGLLANTSGFGWILSLALAATLFTEWMTDCNLRASFSGPRWDPLLSALIIIIAGSAAAAQMIPPSDAAYPALPAAESVGWNPWYAARSLSTVWRAYIPVPVLYPRVSWHFNVLSGRDWTRIVMVLLSAPLLTMAGLVLRRAQYALLLFTLGTAGILAFLYLGHFGSIRHHGHLFLLLLASLWIARISRPSVDALPWSNWWLMSILVLQVIGGAILYLEDLRKPFSIEQRTASFLQESGLGTLPIVGTSSAASALAGHLDREIVDLDRGRRNKMQLPGVVDRAREMLTPEIPTFLLVSSDSLPQNARDPGVRLMAYFAPGILPDERYYVYLIRRDLDATSNHGESR